MAETGRPPIPDDEVARLQELYLSLLRLGLSEKKINAVEGMCSWDTRYSWLSDDTFSARRSAAQKQGVEMGLVAHEERLEEVYEMGLVEAANKPLVDLLKEMGQHARWKASKLNSDVYGDKLKTDNKTEVSGGLTVTKVSYADK